LIFVIGTISDSNAQIFEPKAPTSPSDTAKIKADTTANKPKSKVHPLLAHSDFFLNINPLLGQPFSYQINTQTKNPKDTCLYPSFPMDSSAVRVNNYRQQYINQGNHLHQFNLGEPGSPMYQGFEPSQHREVVEIGCNPFGDQIQRAKDMSYYRAFAPFTEFNYLQGPGKTIALNALHTQNFSPGWNVTLDYRSIINQEQYVGAEQNNQFRNIKLGSLYQSPNNRYKQLIALTWNRSSRNENGGLETDSLFFIPQPNDKWALRTLGYYTPSLTTAASKFRQFEHFLNHRYYLNKRWSLSQEIGLQRINYQYKDSKRDTLYYGAKYFDSKLNTSDSNAWNVYTQKTGVEFHVPLRVKQFSLGLRHVLQTQNYQSKQSQFASAYTQAKAAHSVEFYSKASGNLLPQIYTLQTISGYGKGTKKTQITLPLISKITLFQAPETTWINQSSDSVVLPKINPEFINKPKRMWGLFLQYNNQFQPTTLQQQVFFANHFQYQKTLLFTGDKQFKVLGWLQSYSKNTAPKLRAYLSLQSGTWINPTMSIDSTTVTQLTNANYTGFDLSMSCTIHKFYLTQLISNKTFKSGQLNNLFNYGVPVWKSTTSLQFKTPAFHHAMDLTLGADIQYTSKFQTTYYRPDAATFVVDANKTESGNYFELDLYAVARVQTVDIFLKAEHINEIFIIPGFNTRYQYIAGYPIQPYRIRFGLNWKFYN
jgi:hypothetical protein